MRRVLVLAGGGVRGAMQLDPLIELERLHKQKLCEAFDLMVGTSVGAITAGILATGKLNAYNYKKIFLKTLPKIFKRSWWSFIPMVGPKYKRKAFYKMCDEIVGKDAPMGIVCRTKFLCTSVDFCDALTHYFKSWEGKDGLLKLKDVIARSFAAPYYFGSLVDKNAKQVWLDGGVGVSNCPLDIAYVESIIQKWSNEVVEFTIIGTGTVNNKIAFKKASDIGTIFQVLKGYLKPGSGGIARVQATSNKINRKEAIAKVNKNIKIKYYNCVIGDKYDALDKTKYTKYYLKKGKSIAGQIT